MIKLPPYPEIPFSLRSKKVTQVLERIKNKIKKKERVISANFPSYWQEDDIKESIWQHHYGKCCFCERKRDKKRESDVEHYRPKAGVTEDADHPGYWWLAYVWDNYLFSCKLCNQQYKKNQFPLLPGGIRANNPDDNLDNEKPVLINPVKDNPEELIGYDWQEGSGILVKAVGLDKDGRGHITVNHLTGINDYNVMEERAHLINSLEAIVHIIKGAQNSNNQMLISEYSIKIKTETEPYQSFAGFRRAFFRSMGLEKFVCKDY